MTTSRKYIYFCLFVVLCRFQHILVSPLIRLSLITNLSASANYLLIPHDFRISEERQKMTDINCNGKSSPLSRIEQQPLITNLMHVLPIVLNGRARIISKLAHLQTFEKPILMPVVSDVIFFNIHIFVASFILKVLFLCLIRHNKYLQKQ